MSAILTSEDARLITDSAAAFVTAHGGPANARKRPDPAAAWQAIGELGWFGIDVPESKGGLGLGMQAACIVAKEAGRALLSVPLTPGIAVAPMLAVSDAPPLRAALDALLDGRRFVTLCRELVAQDGVPQALRFIADADHAQAVMAVHGIGESFEVRCLVRDAAGVRSETATTIDGGTLMTWHLDVNAWRAADLVVHGAAGEIAWHAALDRLRLLDAAYLCGLASSALAMGVNYLRLRHQFGVPIGSFQALQHRAADLHIQHEATCALLGEAVRAFGSPRQHWAAAAVIRRAGAVALRVTKENIQFHGAIGFTDEHDAGLYLRRTLVLSARHARTPLASGAI